MVAKIIGKISGNPIYLEVKAGFLVDFLSTIHWIAH